MKLFSLVALLNILNFTNVFAHGENLLGPHNGFIRMPGAFHTELTPTPEGAYSIYLMTVGNKFPVTRDSSVELIYKGKKSSVPFSCRPMLDHFICTTVKKINVKTGQLILKATRFGVKGNDAIYDLPLKLSMPTGQDMSKMKD